MSDIIKLLPDSIANQIAAGEVIQRPASVLKELMENAVDAQSTEIKVVIKDAGKSLVQVIDNGLGMTLTDARLAFERHATSKIQDASDLFALTTFGFRGEALPSIASVAEVELKTKQEAEELGTLLQIAASKIINQVPISCTKGSNFVVRNLFFNVPARRRFLKSDSTEYTHILTEFQRVVLAYPAISFSITHNNHLDFQLPTGSILQRISQLFGKPLQNHLIPVSVETTIIKIKGFISKPELPTRKSENQFFFVNLRYMRNPYFHRSIVSAYENLLQADQLPAYFLYFEVDPKEIDINIHPTKTEIKFQNAEQIFHILRVAVKEALGKFEVWSTLDFDNAGDAIDIPVLNRNKDVQQPQVQYNQNYNPFKTITVKSGEKLPRNPEMNWADLEKQFEQGEEIVEQKQIDLPETNQPPIATPAGEFLLFKHKYVITSVKSGLMFVHRKRAFVRIWFERMCKALNEQETIACQTLLYPYTFELKPDEVFLMRSVMEILLQTGLDIREFGNNSFVISSIPEGMPTHDLKHIVDLLIENIKNNTDFNLRDKIVEQLAHALAKGYVYGLQDHATIEEMGNMMDMLFACEMPNYTPDGRTIMHIVPLEDIDNKFKIKSKAK